MAYAGPLFAAAPFAQATSNWPPPPHDPFAQMHCCLGSRYHASFCFLIDDIREGLALSPVKLNILTCQ